MPRTKNAGKIVTSSRTSDRVHDRHRFRSQAHQSWGEARRHCHFVVERAIDPALDEAMGLSSALQPLGWEPIIQFFKPTDAYYPELVLEFYANSLDRSKNSTADIRSVVRGVPVTINPRIIAEKIRVQDEGEWTGAFGGTIYGNTSWEEKEALRRFGVRKCQSRARYNIILLASQFKPEDRILLLLMSSLVCPRSRSLNEIRTSDLYFLDMCRHGEDFRPISLPQVIFHSMREFLSERPKAIPFPRLITQLLGDQGVNFDNQRPTIPPLITGFLNIASLSRHNIINKDGEWVYKEEPTDSSDSSDDQAPTSSQSSQPQPLAIEIPSASDAQTDTGGAATDHSPSSPPRRKKSRTGLLTQLLSTCNCLRAEIQTLKQEQAEERAAAAEERAAAAREREQAAKERAELNARIDDLLQRPSHPPSEGHSSDH